MMISIRLLKKQLNSRLRIRNVKKAIDARNEADAMVFQTEKALEEVGDKLDAADKAAVEADFKALKESLKKQTQRL